MSSIQSETSRKSQSPTAEPLLDVKNLETRFTDHRKNGGVARAVNGISFSLQKGETLALVGESGCGKSVTAHSIMRLLPKTASHPVGKINFFGQDLLTLTPDQIADVRGRKISMIFQEPQMALNPVFSIGDQVREPLAKHLKLSAKECNERVKELLSQMGLRDPEKIMNSYPHQFSGGMRQRVLIAMAMACEPDLLICDEPTTALDVTIQAQVLQLIKTLQKSKGMAVLLITHDLAIVHQMSERIAVMYSGQICEEGPTKDVIENPAHPYTQALIQCLPREVPGRLPSISGTVRPANELSAVGCHFADRCPRALEKCRTETPLLLPVPMDRQDRMHRPVFISTEPFAYLSGHTLSCWNPSSHRPEDPAGPGDRGRDVSGVANGERIGGAARTWIDTVDMKIENLRVFFPVGSQISLPWNRSAKLRVHAVDGVDLSLRKGKTLALVGESGCGKSTLGQSVVKLIPEARGRVLWKGEDLLSMDAPALRAKRKEIQILFQDPYASLNPRMTVQELLMEGLRVHSKSENEVERNARIRNALQEVGLPESSMDRYPHQFSGGQRQRLALARALVLEPELIVLDEATSALDVSLQSQILNLLKDLQSKRGLSYLSITHDMGAVSFLADEVAVMYLGKIVEFGPKSEILKRPQHPYTKGLLGAVPSLDRPLASVVLGEVPSSVVRPSGCHFHPRCLTRLEHPELKTLCDGVVPDKFRQPGSDHWATCHALQKSSR